MRAGTYYFLAGVLVLATLPMYRYIFKRARQLDHQSPVHVAQQPRVLYSYVPSKRVSAPTRTPLLPGELCEGGVVILVSGNTYTQALDVSGNAVRCSAGFVIDR